MPVRYSDIPRRLTLAPPEAAALALAAADACDGQAGGVTVSLPSADGIQLHESGVITVAATAPAAAEDERARRLALLIRTLLSLDGAGVRAKVPGALMVALARACGQIDLPPPSYQALKDTLAKLAPERDARLLADLHRRCAAPIVRVDAPIGSERGSPRERRRSGPSVSALRLELRLRDRELFEALGRARSGRRVAVGSAALLWLLAAALGFLAVVGAEHVRGWVPPPMAVSTGLR